MIKEAILITDAITTIFCVAVFSRQIWLGRHFQNGLRMKRRALSLCGGITLLINLIMFTRDINMLETFNTLEIVSSIIIRVLFALLSLLWVLIYCNYTFKILTSEFWLCMFKKK